MRSEGKRILIVDSDPNILIALEFLMAQNGFQVAIARTGEEALESLTAAPPDLILLEVQLPYRTGFEVCQIIRRRPEWSTIKVVLLSSRGRDVDIAKGNALGADAYVTKPFSNKQLVQKIHEVLNRNQ